MFDDRGVTKGWGYTPQPKGRVNTLGQSSFGGIREDRGKCLSTEHSQSSTRLTGACGLDFRQPTTFFMDVIFL